MTGPALLVEVPYTWAAASKNRAHVYGRRGVHTAPARRALADTIATRVLLASRQQGLAWGPGKTWLAILVIKSSARGDAINVLDTCADAVARGLRLNDAAFSAVVDWAIRPDDPPMLRIAVWQAAAA